jgi:hypothetical protein
MAKAIISKVTRFIDAVKAARGTAVPFFVQLQRGEDRDRVVAAHRAESPEPWADGRPPIFVSWALGSLPREEFCTRESRARPAGGAG